MKNAGCGRHRYQTLNPHRDKVLYPQNKNQRQLKRKKKKETEKKSSWKLKM